MQASSFDKSFCSFATDKLGRKEAGVAYSVGVPLVGVRVRSIV